MKIAVQVPMKARPSTRVPNKNFRDLCGKPLAFWLLDELVDSSPPEWDLFVDSEKESVMDFFGDRYKDRICFHKRAEWFASDQANGNHLIYQFAVSKPYYDIYVQAFVTAVTLSGQIITEAVQAFVSSIDRYDSMLLVTEETGWFWFDGQAVNYAPDRPDGLPRSQDAPVLKETTGLYAITREAVFRTGCRIGKAPLFYEVPQRYSADVDTMEDLLEAQRVLSSSLDSSGEV